MPGSDDVDASSSSSQKKSSDAGVPSEETRGGEDGSSDKSDKKTSEQRKSMADQLLLRQALRSSPFFASLDDEQIDCFIDVATIKKFYPGEGIIEEGKRDDRMEFPNVGERAAKTDQVEDVAGLDENAWEDLLEDSWGDIDEISEDLATDTWAQGETDSRRRDAKESGGLERRTSSSGTMSLLYVIRVGKANVLYDSFNPASLGSGHIFGEGGFLYGRQHSASIVAANELECWVVDYPTFRKDVLQSTRLKNQFHKYAMRRDGNGRPYLTMDEFIEKCLKDESTVGAADGQASIASIYESILLTSAKTGPSMMTQKRIYVDDFCLFCLLASRQDPEVDIAFLLMDRFSTGSITKADFEAYLLNVPYFDPKSEFVQRHFGNGKAIRHHQFSQFLIDLQLEMGKQKFLHRVKQLDEQYSAKRYPKGGHLSGFLSPKDFVETLKATCGWRLPKGVVTRLESLYCKDPSDCLDKSPTQAGEGNDDSVKQVADFATQTSSLTIVDMQDHQVGTLLFAYVDFLAFQDVLVGLPNIFCLIEKTCQRKKGPISRDDLQIVNRSLGIGGQLSRRQVDIVFQLFDLDGDGYISVADANSVCDMQYNDATLPLIERKGVPKYTQPSSVDTDNKEGTIKETDKFPQQSLESSSHIVGTVLGTVSQFGIASLAGAFGVIAVYPFDIVKTRMMNQRIVLEGERRYVQSFDCLRQIIQKEGLLGMYRGVLPASAAAGPEKMIKKLISDLLKGLGDKESAGQPHWSMEVMSGGCAGACQLLITNPLEITKIRLQLQGETAQMYTKRGMKPPGDLSFSEIAARLGASGLYRGAAACLLRDIPFGAIFFPAYSMTKEYLVSREWSDGSVSPFNLVLAGTLAAFPASILTTPADVVKTRLQAIPRAGESRYSGIRDCVNTMYKNEGWTAFFKGSAFRVCRIAPQFGISMYSYEMLSKLSGFDSLFVNPPTNAPVSLNDYRTAFRIGYVKDKMSDSDDLIKKLGFKV